MHHVHSSPQSTAAAATPSDGVEALDDDLLAALDDVLSFGEVSTIANAFSATDASMDPGATFSDELDSMLSIEIPTLLESDQSSKVKQEASTAPERTEASSKSGKDVRAAPYKKPNKPRRRRRPKHELDYLRAKVADMEKELVALQKEPGMGSPAAVSAAIIYGGEPGKSNADGEQDVFLHWKKIAERQREEVNQSVMENLKLRATLENQLKVARALEAAIDQQQREAAAQSLPWQRVGGGPHQPTTMSDELIYALLNESVGTQYLELDAVMELSGLAGVNHDLKNGVQVHHDATGVSFSYEMARLLPFSMRTVHRAMWSILRYGTAKDMMLGPFQTRVVDNNHMNVTMMEKLQLGDSRYATIVRRFAMRRFFEQDRVGVVWAAYVEINGSVFVRLREKGYTTTSSFNFGRGTDPSGPNIGVLGSITRMATLMTPEMAPFVSEQQATEHIGEMTELVIAAHQHSLDMVFQIVDTLLLRETMGGKVPGGDEEEDVTQVGSPVVVKVE